MDKKLLTIQDISCFGQCSLTVALPVISACGIETVILPSAVLSTHTAGFTGYTFRDLTGDMGKIEESWINNNLKFDAFYTGYVCENQIDPILSIMKSCAAETKQSLLQTSNSVSMPPERFNGNDLWEQM